MPQASCFCVLVLDTLANEGIGKLGEFGQLRLRRAARFRHSGELGLEAGGDAALYIATRQCNF